VCSRPSDQARVHAALADELETDVAFRQRCLEAACRGLAMRRRSPSNAGSSIELDTLMRLELRPLEAELARLLGA
jgi:hypothetical protein